MSKVKVYIKSQYSRYNSVKGTYSHYVFCTEVEAWELDDPQAMKALDEVIGAHFDDVTVERWVEGDCIGDGTISESESELCIPPEVEGDCKVYDVEESIPILNCMDDDGIWFHNPNQ